ncbi:competence protein ComK [Mammaliicoccus sciuri]|uniref:competence protein ComK n=1 Tax=Mammaliicoccus TaxID=2803850 RepID=UPI001E4D7ABD|nr:competence protein ComK [Mammaliicoccus sciuri]MCO4323334.1 competence protein ComK [Mammaliicoccus sciuri]MCY1024799.1 competence protein ComK [Mammaliicoccus sciuri]MEB5790788.1 competence protein ComK [Mammaliicoccus sciuri]MEB6057954.1 competence protein ComK [Mammaliicoccus sciuri]MEB6233449.1 competence protein ComK [Mammaliicoccus sciuri]
MNLINPNMTLLKYSDDSAYRFQIEYLNQSTVYTNHSIPYLINDALKIEGASLKSREHYAKYVLNISKLLPILIYASEDFVLFPTSAKSNYNYMLINSKHIVHIDAYKHYTKLLLINQQTKVIYHENHIISRKLGESLRLIQFQKHHLYSQNPSVNIKKVVTH